MALQGFTIHSPSTVIKQDNRDPETSWYRHEREAGANRGGVDVVAAVGTPVYAWADGTVLHQPDNGSAGNVIKLALAHDPGWSLDYKHLSRYAVPHGRWVAEGTLIGYSGDSGAPGQPHVHYNLVDPNGIRRNPWKYIDAGTATAGRPADITSLDKEDLMEIAHIYPSNRNDSAAFALDIEDPTKPLAQISGAEFRTGQVIGVRQFAVEPGDFQELLRQRGMFVKDGALRISPYTADTLKALPSDIARQYAFNWNGFLAVRAAG